MTKQITIQGVQFDVTERYATGHVLTEIEAKVLNQTLAENLRNNFADVVKAAKGEAEAAGEALNVYALQEKFAEYESAYTFASGPGRGPVAPKDPVGAEAFRLAKADILAAIKAKGLKVGAKGQVSMEKVNALAEQRLANHNDAYRAKAEVIVAAKSGTVGAEMDLDDLAA